VQQSARVQSEIKVQKPASSELFRGMLDDCMYGMGTSSRKEKDTTKKDILLEKVLKKRFINQACAIPSSYIFHSMDPKMQNLIQVPWPVAVIQSINFISAEPKLRWPWPVFSDSFTVKVLLQLRTKRQRLKLTTHRTSKNLWIR
jgi:hypothetical protein